MSKQVFTEEAGNSTIEKNLKGQNMAVFWVVCDMSAYLVTPIASMAVALPHW